MRRGIKAVDDFIAAERDTFERWARWRREHKRERSWQTQEGEKLPPPVDIARPQIVPQYTCPACHDNGVIKVDSPSGRYGLDGWRYDLVPCQCRAQQIAERRATRIKAASNLTTEMEAMTFASYHRDWDAPSFDAAQMFAEGLCDGGKPDAPFLLLFGRWGSGKTHLMAAIAHYGMQHGRQPLFTVVPDLLDWFKAAFSNQDHDFETRFTGIRDADVLLLDDLGAENSTPWAQEKLYQIINHRYASRLPTVFSTNLTPDKMESKIADRLMDLAVCERICTVNKSYRQHDARSKQRATRQSKKAS